MSTHLEPQTVIVRVDGPCIPMRNQPGGHQDSLEASVGRSRMDPLRVPDARSRPTTPGRGSPWVFWARSS